MRGLQIGPETVVDPYDIRKPRLFAVIVLGLAMAGLAHAGIDDSADPVGVVKGATPITEDPVPVTTADPKFWVTLDMRPAALAFSSIFTNPENPSPTVPKDWGVKIIMPDPIDADSECNATQVRKCNTACGKQRQMLVSCDVQFEWQPDGTATRTVTCTCASPMDPKIAGTVANVTEIKLRD